MTERQAHARGRHHKTQLQLYAVHLASVQIASITRYAVVAVIYYRPIARIRLIQYRLVKVDSLNSLYRRSIDACSYWIISMLAVIRGQIISKNSTDMWRVMPH